MSAELGVIGAGLGLMYFLMVVANSLAEKHDALKFFLLASSMVTGLLVSQLGVEIATTALMSADTLSLLNRVYWVWAFVCISFLFYFGIMFIKTALNAFRGEKMGADMK
jgi:hypothetical protein